MTRASWIAGLVFVAIAFGVTAWCYSALPARIPQHWNIRGELDGWGPRSSAWILPGVMLGIWILFRSLSAISPRPFDLDRNSPALLTAMLATVGLLGYLHLLTLWAATGHGVDIGRAMVGGVGASIALLGNRLGQIKRNLYVGVRTPWPLASERVWSDTHRVAARWFVGAGVIGMIAILIDLPAWAGLIPLIPAVVWPVAFSYLRYRKLERAGDLIEDPGAS